jgi:hypothetical protein
MANILIICQKIINLQNRNNKREFNKTVEKYIELK